MEPLSGIASVLAIAGTANVVLRSIERLRTSIRAPEAIDALVYEVQALRALLRDVSEAHELLKQASLRLNSLEVVDPLKVTRNSAIAFYLVQAGRKLDELDEIINKKSTKGSWNGSSRSKRVRLQWLRNQSHVEILQTHLRSINNNLTTCLTAMAISGQLHLQVSVQEVAQVTDKISGDRNRLNSAICSRLSVQGDQLSQLSKQILQTRTSNKKQQSTPAQDEELGGSLIPGTEQIDNTGITRYTACSLEGAIKVKTSNNNLDQYSRSSTCRCYPRRRIHITNVLSSLIGSMCITWLGGPISRPCEQCRCRAKLPVTFNMSYYFPRWLLAMVVNVFLSFDRAGSPSVSLQMPRIRPDTSKIFHLATAGDIGGMQSMFERGLASPNDVSYTFGYSVLHCAVDIEHVETIKFLLSQGANAEHTNRLKLTPADLAWNRILSKRTEASKRQTLSSLFGETSQADQIESRRLTMLQQIVLGLINVDIDLALKDGSPCELNARDADGNTVLSWSTRCANEHATRALLRRGAEHHHISRFGSTALHYAAGARAPSCILPMLEAGADAKIRNACLQETPLHVAALRHDEPEDYIAPLLSYGADVNACDHEGSSVLAFAVQANHCRSARYLLDRGADIDCPDESGLTPIGLAVVYNHHALLAMLLEYGANVASTTVAGETLLHLCALYGDMGTLDVLKGPKLKLVDQHAVNAQGLRAIAHARLRGEEFLSAFTRHVTM